MIFATNFKMMYQRMNIVHTKEFCRPSAKSPKQKQNTGWQHPKTTHIVAETRRQSKIESVDGIKFASESKVCKPQATTTTWKFPPAPLKFNVGVARVPRASPVITGKLYSLGDPAG